jgi:Putative transposase/Transposase zinc-binding domain
MNRPTPEVADILRKHGDRFTEQNRTWLSFQQLKVLRAIKRCRTAALGGHVDHCSGCGHSAISFNSCRNRHCPKCQAQARQRWLALREQELLGLSYFHVVFTLPHELNRLCQRNPAVLYNLLFRASAETLLEVAADSKHLGAEIGFLAILHTWGQNLLLHPHLHCLVPAGGFSPDHTQWVHPKYNFLLPLDVLKPVFRGKFVDGLKRAYRRKKLDFGGATKSLQEPKAFAAFLQTLHRKEWVVYAKHAFGGPTPVLRYLGRYTHRVAISNHRLTAFDGENVTFRWKDYARGNKQRLMTLHAHEFLRRYVQHVLPLGFVRIRQFGFLANRLRSQSLTLIRRLLLIETTSTESPLAASPATATWKCPRCGGVMQILSRLTHFDLAFRNPIFDTS